MIEFETSVSVERPIEEVFAFVSNPLLFPRWNSAVQAVHGTSGETGERGSTYSMERDLPQGRVENDLEILDRKRPNEFVIRTTSGPTPFLYRYRFKANAGRPPSPCRQRLSSRASRTWSDRWPLAP